jgi:D-amino-acid dehydrogenase
MEGNSRKVIVVGAGVVGMASAVNLLRDGHQVTVVDREDPGEGCSKGNAGLIVAGSFLPRSLPGTIFQVPKWLLDPRGPLFIRPTYLPRVLPWFFRFAAVGTTERVKASAAAFHALHCDAMKDHISLAQSIGAEELARPAGYLKVYRTDAGFEGDAFERRVKAEYGFKVDILGPGEIREIEPSLAPVYRHGVFQPDDGHTPNPWRLTRRLAEHFTGAGGTILRREVRAIEAAAGESVRLQTDGGDLDSEMLVVAAGAWSGRLAARLGDAVPLEAERGYNATVEKPNVVPTRPVYDGDFKIIVTPQEAGLRITGIAEFAGLEAPPNYRRSRMLLEMGRKMFPELKVDRVSEWMGHRPSLPDSLPVIGPSSGHANVFYAFGHGHTGVTASATTGRLIADLVGGRPPAIDLAPFAVRRFS